MLGTELAQQASDLTHPQQGLRAVAALRRLTDSLELQQVEAALRQGMTWPEIAQELGVTRQAVHKKYRHRVPKDAVRERRST